MFYLETTHLNVELLTQSQLLTYLIAGHDTTSSALRWGIKHLTDSQGAQMKLRAALKSAYPAAVYQGRLPTLPEILKTRVPYLDAVVEEALRCAKVLPMTMREALVDTQVLGKPIPKGTTVVLMGNGPGMTIPSTSVPLDEKTYTRSDIARSYMHKYGRFDDDGIEAYRPERWLKTTTDEAGLEQLEFDANAGPLFVFGMGPRACFGRKLAYLKMRVLYTLVFLKYKFEQIPDELADFDEVVLLTRAPKKVFVRLAKEYI
jgi:cytochrome P450